MRKKEKKLLEVASRMAFIDTREIDEIRLRGEVQGNDGFRQLCWGSNPTNFIWAAGFCKDNSPDKHWQFFRPNGSIKWEQIYIR